MERVTRLRDDLAQIRLPMDGNPMKYVNAYLVHDDDDRFTLVDCGWKAGDVREALALALEELDVRFERIARLAVTHAHFDHYGLAATLLRDGIETFALHAREDEFAHALLRDRAESDRVADEWLARNGLPIAGVLEGDLEHSRTELVEGASHLAEGDRIGRLRAVFTPGHTPGHLCFVDERSGYVLTGDHVLPRVSPHVGVWFPGIGDPLGSYVASLRRVRAIATPLALPAHVEPFEDLAGRVDELLAHHEEREQRVLDALGTGRRTATEIATMLPWTRRATPFLELAEAHRQFAVAETIAHLEHLRARSIVAADPNDDPIRYVRTTA